MISPSEYLVTYATNRAKTLCESARLEFFCFLVHIAEALHDLHDWFSRNYHVKLADS